MVRASALPEGVTAPIASGFSIQERKNRTSSSIRKPFFCSKARMRLPILRSIRPLAEFEQTNLSLNFLFEDLQGLQGHRQVTLRND